MEMEILEMCDDDQMECLRATFLKTGKGRRAALPTIEATNKLFLQLHQLRFEGKVAITEVEKWFLKLFPESAYPSEPNRLWKRIQRILKAANGKSGDQLLAFLQERVNLDLITDSLQSVGVTRSFKEEMFVKCHLTNTIVMDLGNFLIPEGYSYKHFLNILKKLSLSDISVTVEDLRQKFLSAEKTRAKLIKNKSRCPEALSRWLNDFFFSDKKAPEITKTRPEVTPALPSPLSSTSDWPPLCVTETPTLSAVNIASTPQPPPPTSISDWPPLFVSHPTEAPVFSAEKTATTSQSSSDKPTADHSSTQIHEATVAQPSSSGIDSIDRSPSSRTQSATAETQSFTKKSSAQAQPSAKKSSIQATPSAKKSTTAKVTRSGKILTSTLAPLCDCEKKSTTDKSDLTVNMNLINLKQENSMLKKKHIEISKEMKTLKKSKVYKSNSLLKKKCSEQASIIKNLKLQNNNLKSEISQLKQEKISLQKSLFKSKRKFEVLKENSNNLLYTLNHINHLDDTENQVNLKDSKFNKFSDSVRLTYMSLQGEANVSASNCSKVVQIVANNLFNHSLSMKDLPCSSSALKMMNEGNHVAKYQVVDELNKSDHFTYASDGTSRQKLHYMERHLVLKNGKSLSMGFSHIASDDANSMLEQTIQIFHDFVNVYGKDMGDEEKDSILKDIISKMNSVMSDRASNMKLLNKKIHEWRKDVLNDDDVTTHFLYCNAHFLLGLCSAAEKGVTEIEGEIVNSSGVRLGRDDDQKFKQFFASKESAAFRCVRTAAEVLGPRGDEKSGVRQEWLTYCDQINVSSKFSSYRSNRFNNVFDNASALLYHRNHILDFLINKTSGENLKLQSVVADLQDVKVISIVASLSLFNLTVTGPYWRLMNSNLPYGSFPVYVKKLNAIFDKFLSLSSFDEHVLTPVFADFSLSDVTTFQFVKDVCSLDIVMSAFKSIVKESKIVLERQLCDFLEGGIFGGEIPIDVKNILDNCPLTNLTGERLFGDLDYDMNKRRRASLHLRSTLNMWKHNNTVNWISNLSEEKQNKILLAARKNCENLELQSKQYEVEVREKINQKLNDNKRKRDEKDFKDKQKKADLLDIIISHGGLCKTQYDLDVLLEKGNVQSLRDQIRFRKLFFNQKHLRVSGTTKEIYNCLLHQIIEESSTEGNSSTSHKRVKLSVDDGDDSE